MNYIDNFIEAFPPAYDDEESRNEAVANHQQALDTLYWICHQFNVSVEGAKALCDLAHVQYETFASYKGVPA